MRALLMVMVVSGCDALGLDDNDPNGRLPGTPLPTTTVPEPTDPGPNPATVSGNETCLLLYGGNDRVRGPDEGLPMGGMSRTLQAWVRTRSHQEQIALSYGRPSPDQGFMLGTLGGYPLARAGIGNAHVVGDLFLADDEWHHLAVAYDGRIVVLTVDGEVAAVEELYVDTIEGDLVAGNTPTGDLTKPWIGWLDDARIFSGARAPDDVADDPDGLDVVRTSLLLHWDFEVAEGSEGPGVTVPDVSRNGHEGTTGGGQNSPAFPACR